MCPEEHLQRIVSDRNYSNFQGFRLNYEVSGTLTNNFLQGCQNRKKMFRGTYSGKSFLKREKLTKFLCFWANSSVHSVGKVRQSCQNCNLRSLGRLWGKKHVWNFAHCFKFSWNLRQKNKSFTRKLFSELSQIPSARPQESFAENQFFYQRNYVFC